MEQENFELWLRVEDAQSKLEQARMLLGLYRNAFIDLPNAVFADKARSNHDPMAVLLALTEDTLQRAQKRLTGAINIAYEGFRNENGEKCTGKGEEQ